MWYGTIDSDAAVVPQSRSGGPKAASSHLWFALGQPTLSTTPGSGTTKAGWNAKPRDRDGCMGTGWTAPKPPGPLTATSHEQQRVECGEAGVLVWLVLVERDCLSEIAPHGGPMC